MDSAALQTLSTWLWLPTQVPLVIHFVPGEKCPEVNSSKWWRMAWLLSQGCRGNRTEILEMRVLKKRQWTGAMGTLCAPTFSFTSVSPQYMYAVKGTDSMTSPTLQRGPWANEWVRHTALTWWLPRTKAELLSPLQKAWPPGTKTRVEFLIWYNPPRT
jgi:hypothetical protein